MTTHHPRRLHLPASRLSRRRFLQSSAIAASAAGVSSLGFPHIARAQPAQLVVADGGGALGAAYKIAFYDTFTEQTGIQIIQAPYAGIARMTAMVEADNIDIDLFNIDPVEANVAAQRGWLQPIDYGLIDREPIVPEALYEHYILAEFAAYCIHWNTDLVGTPPSSWAEVWDTGAIPGQRGFWRKAFQTMEVALLADGVAPEDLYPLDVDRALDSLDRIRDDILFWETGAQAIQTLIDGEVVTGACWNGRSYQPMQDGAPVGMTFDQALLVAGCWTMLQDGPNVEAAMQLIDHINTAEHQATYAMQIPYGPVVKAAMDMLPAERLPYLPNSAQNVGNVIFQNYDAWAELGDMPFDRFNDWLLG